MTRVLVSGADGFIGRNLCQRLAERSGVELIPITRSENAEALAEAVVRADFVFHLAGINRPTREEEFAEGNVGFTSALTDALASAGSVAPIVYASSTQAEADNPYGHSKRAAEEVLFRHGRESGAPIHIYRLPNVFGKWARPHYNSAVATFCHNVARGQELYIRDPAAPLTLIYIDDLIDRFLGLLDGGERASGYREPEPVHHTTVGEVAEIIGGFPAIRQSLIVPPVGVGLVRALYATYLTYLEPEQFVYDVPIHSDPRGAFVELLKTRDSGQFSYFTAGPGVTRGDHYHHTKAEKFLVISGTAAFAFRHLVSGESHEVLVRGGEGRVVETIPGWTHNITNIGENELIVMLWANEIFDRSRPDTVAMKV